MQRGAVAVEPLPVGVFQQRAERGAHAGVVVVQPRSFLGVEQARFQRATVERAHGQRFEGVVIAELGALGLDHHGQVLVADAVPAGLVQARFDRADHARLQRHQRAVGHRRANAVRAFVHVEKVAHAVAGAVAVIHAGGPQRCARQRIELRAAGALGEARARQRNHALHHQGGVAPLLGGGFAQRQHAGDVGGAAQVLAAGVDQQQAPGLQRAVRFGCGAVMRQRAVGLVAGDGGKALADVLRLRGALLAEQRVHVQLGQRHAGGEPLFQPTKAAHQRGAVAAHHLADVFQFGRALDRLEGGAGVGGLDTHDVGRDGGGHRAGHAAAVEQQAVACAEFLQARGYRGVIGDADAVGRQRADQCVVELAARHEQRGAPAGFHQQVRQEHRVALDVAAAQVG